MAANILVGAIIAILIILDIRYIFKKNKSGECIGCVAAEHGCSGHGACHGGKKMTKEEIKAAADKFMAMKRDKETETS